MYRVHISATNPGPTAELDPSPSSQVQLASALFKRKIPHKSSPYFLLPSLHYFEQHQWPI